MARVLGALLLSLVLLGSALLSTSGAEPTVSMGVAPRYVRYHNDTGLRINTLVVRRGCLWAEDSAAHLVLRNYDPESGRAVYGCERSGY